MKKTPLLILIMFLLVMSVAYAYDFKLDGIEQSFVTEYCDSDFDDAKLPACFRFRGGEECTFSTGYMTCPNDRHVRTNTTDFVLEDNGQWIALFNVSVYIAGASSHLFSWHDLVWDDTSTLKIHFLNYNGGSYVSNWNQRIYGTPNTPLLIPSEEIIDASSPSPIVRLGVIYNPTTSNLSMWNYNDLDNPILWASDILVDDIYNMVNGDPRNTNDDVTTVWYGVQWYSFEEGESTPSFTITTIDTYDSSAINNFTVTLFNSTDSYTNATTTGSITWDNLTGIYDLTINSSANGGYFERTYENVNVSNDLEAKLWQAILYVNVSEIITNTKLTDFWAGAPLQLNQSNSTGWAKLFMKAGTYNISANATGYLKWWETITISNLELKYANISLGKSNFTITAINARDGSIVENFTITLMNSDPSYDYQTSKSTWINEVIGSENASLVFRTLEGNYNISITAAGFAPGEAEYTINLNNLYSNYTFSLYTSNSINFIFYDEQTSLKITNKNIDIELISDVFSANYTSNNGTFYIDLLTPSIYLIRFNADDYNERHYYFLLTNQTATSLNLFMINSSLATPITATVTDQDGEDVESAYIKVLRYEIQSNSYRLREIYKTDNQGETSLNIIKNDEFYKFIVEQPFGTIKLITDPAYVINDEIGFQILNREIIAARFFKANGVVSVLTFDNNTNLFSIIFNDPSNLMSELCLNIYKITLHSKTLVNHSCTQSSSGSIALGVANETGTTYLAEVIVGFSPTEYLLDSISHTFLVINDVNLIWGPWINIFLTITMALTSLWSIPIAVILTTIPTLILSMFNIISLPVMYALSLFVASIVVAAIVWRNR